MTRIPKEHALIKISISPFDDYSLVTLWIREPGGALIRLGQHRSWSLDIGREDLLADDADTTLEALVQALHDRFF